MSAQVAAVCSNLHTSSFFENMSEIRAFLKLKYEQNMEKIQAKYSENMSKIKVFVLKKCVNLTCDIAESLPYD